MMQMVVIEGRLVRLTNLDKPMWSGLGVTKGELLHYPGGDGLQFYAPLAGPANDCDALS